MSIVVVDDYKSKTNGIYGKLCHRLYCENFPAPVMYYFMHVPEVGIIEIFPSTLGEINNIIQLEYTSDYFHTIYKPMIVDHYLLPKRIEGLKCR